MSFKRDAIKKYIAVDCHVRINNQRTIIYYNKIVVREKIK